MQPIGVGAEQSFQICSNDIISENNKDYKYNKFTVADCSVASIGNVLPYISRTLRGHP